jgi:hypothetical protein
MSGLPDANSSKPSEEFCASMGRFLGEQDGSPERELKLHIATLLKGEPSVHRAYLARVLYDCAPSWDVALCIAATNPNAQELNNRVGRVFAAIFRRDAHLDILFLSDQQEALLSSVCRPFYSAL